MTQIDNDEIRKAVREQYGKVAESGGSSDDVKISCCDVSTSCCEKPGKDEKSTSRELGYSETEINEVPEGSNMGLGCGNPQAIASLKKGETVLDLGSGGGFDSFLAGQKVGKTGQVIGVDMTPEMLSKARKNADKGSYQNVEFRLGEIEHLPVADKSVDVIISNCVINLSPEKEAVFQDCFRVLKAGGRLAISDVVATTKLPAQVKQDMSLFTGCISGASSNTEIEKMLKNSGFKNIVIKPKDESKEFIRNWKPGSNIHDYIVSATIEATKPVD